MKKLPSFTLYEISIALIISGIIISLSVSGLQMFYNMHKKIRTQNMLRNEQVILKNVLISDISAAQSVQYNADTTYIVLKNPLFTNRYSIQKGFSVKNRRDTFKVTSSYFKKEFFYFAQNKLEKPWQ